MATVGLPGLATGSSSWPASAGLFAVPSPFCDEREMAMAANNDRSSTDKRRIIAFSSHASFRPKKKNGHADTVLDSGGGGT